MERSAVRYSHATQNSMPFRMNESFISGIFHVMFVRFKRNPEVDCALNTFLYYILFHMCVCDFVHVHPHI